MSVYYSAYFGKKQEQNYDIFAIFVKYLVFNEKSDIIYAKEEV